MSQIDHSSGGEEASHPAEPEQELSLDGVRVLILFGGHRIFGSEIGNIEVFRQMARLGLKARFITRNGYGRSEIQPKLDQLGFEWTTAPFGYHWGKALVGRSFYYLFPNLYGVIGTSCRLWREIRLWKPTHLYCVNWIFFTYAMPAIMWSRLPLIYRAGDELPTHTPLHRWVIEKLARRVALAVCISNFIKARMMSAGFTANKLKVIYNYPPERPVEAVDVKLPEIPHDAQVVLYVGRISKAKGIAVLLEAIEQLISRKRNIVLWAAGTSGESDTCLDDMQARVRAANLTDRVFFLGHVENVGALYGNADIHVCPSLTTEALSHVVLEAKEYGRPSVVFPTGGLPELVQQGVDGYVCRDKSVEALIEGIDYFSGDAAIRLAAGKAARRSLKERFGQERFRREWAQVFVATRSPAP